MCKNVLIAKLLFIGANIFEHVGFEVFSAVTQSVNFNFNFNFISVPLILIGLSQPKDIEQVKNTYIYK
jgi:hypothetical protein